MSKTILVMDMPESCYECCLHNYHFCDVTGDCIEEYMNCEQRPCWCPLQALPKKRKEKYAADVGDRDCGFIDGWNACIDEILYENEILRCEYDGI